MGDFVGAAGEGLAFGAASQPGCWRMAWRVVKWTAIAVVVLVILAMHQPFLALLILVASIGWSILKRRTGAQQQPTRPAFYQEAQPPQRADEAEYQQWREQQRQEQFCADYQRMHRETNPGPDQQPKDTP